MRLTTLLFALVVVVAACGDSGTGTSAAPSQTAAAPETSAAPESSAAPGTAAAGEVSGCPAEPFSGTIERTVEAETGDGVHVAAVRGDGELVSAYAFDFGSGTTYTIYVGDHQIDRDGVGSDTLVAPQGGMLATIFLISDDQLAAGTVLEFRFVPIVDTGGGAQISGFGADDVTGSITIIDITTERICFEIDSTDPQQRLDGTVSAEFA